jgi:hypothetical protein
MFYGNPRKQAIDDARSLAPAQLAAWHEGRVVLGARRVQRRWKIRVAAARGFLRA